LGHKKVAFFTKIRLYSCVLTEMLGLLRSLKRRYETSLLSFGETVVENAQGLR